MKRSTVTAAATLAVLLWTLTPPLAVLSKSRGRADMDRYDRVL